MHSTRTSLETSVISQFGLTNRFLTNQDPLQWPVVKQVLDHIKDDHGEKVYQRCKQEAMSDLKKLSENIKTVRVVI